MDFAGRMPYGADRAGREICSPLRCRTQRSLFRRAGLVATDALRRTAPRLAFARAWFIARLAVLVGVAALCPVHADAAVSVQATDGSAHYAVIDSSNPGTHLQFNDNGFTSVASANYIYGWVINDGTQYLAVYLGTCNTSSTVCHVKDNAGYCWTGTKPANGLWTNIENITDSALASANSCANLPGPTSSDRGATVGQLLNELVDLAGSFLDEVVTEDNVGDGNTGGAPFAFNADAANGGAATGAPTVLAFGDQFNDTFGSDSTNFNFKADLGRAAQQMAAGEAAAYAGGPADGDAAPRNFIPWVTGRYVNFKDGSSTDQTGHLWSVTSGATVRLDKDSAIGAFARYRQGKVSSTALDASLASRFYGGGAFAMLGAIDTLRVTAGGQYEFGKNDSVTSGDSGTFDSRDWSLEGKLEKRFSSGAVWMTPLIGIHYAQLDRDGYTDSGGNAVAAETRKLGDLKYGATFGVASSSASGAGKIFASLAGDWHFQRAADYTLSTGPTLSVAAHTATLGAGFEYAFVGGLTIRLRGDVETEVDSKLFTHFDLGDRLTSWSASGGIGIPLGPRVAKRERASFNLDAAGSPSAASGIARLVVPLN